MRASPRISPAMMLLALFFVLLCATAVLASGASVGKASLLEGTASITRSGKDIEVKAEESVFVGDVLTTGDKGRVSVRFVDESTLVLGTGSQARIDTYVYSGDSSKLLFKFSKGMFRAVTGKIVAQNPKGFNMQTPLATLGIRGSDVFGLLSPQQEDLGALDLGPGHSLDVQTKNSVGTVGQGGDFVSVLASGAISQPKPIPTAMLNIIRAGLSAPGAPDIGSGPGPTAGPPPVPAPTPIITNTAPPTPTFRYTPPRTTGS